MAKEFEKGQHLFFIFENGVAKRNSQNRACCFTDRKKAELHSKGIGEIVEYAPVQYGHFVHDGPRVAGGVDWWHCSNCGRLVSSAETRFDYCNNCGAKMGGGYDDETD